MSNFTPSEQPRQSNSEGSSLNYGSSSRRLTYCDCGLEAIQLTSWKPTNPGRRSVKCPRTGDGNCGFWRWIDPEICTRTKQIIPGLLGRINEIQARVSDLSSRLSKEESICEEFRDLHE